MKGIQIRTAFTMIELIFVIVILGILAAVALPKFAGIQGQAEQATVTAFAGTMSRTVGPMMWSTSISDGHNGSINWGGNSTQFNGKELIHYVDNYPQFLEGSSVDFTRCVTGTTVASPFMDKINTGKLNLFCRDGDQSSAPRFAASANATYSFP